MVSISAAHFYVQCTQTQKMLFCGIFIHSFAIHPQICLYSSPFAGLYCNTAQVYHRISKKKSKTHMLKHVIFRLFQINPCQFCQNRRFTYTSSPTVIYYKIGDNSLENCSLNLIQRLRLLYIYILIDVLFSMSFKNICSNFLVTSSSKITAFTSKFK